jgi:hypothetical protein
MIYIHVAIHELLHTPTGNAHFGECGARQRPGYLPWVGERRDYGSWGWVFDTIRVRDIKTILLTCDSWPLLRASVGELSLARLVAITSGSRNEISYPLGDIAGSPVCDDANSSGFVVPFRLLSIAVVCTGAGPVGIRWLITWEVRSAFVQVRIDNFKSYLGWV